MPSYAFAIGNVRVYLRIGPKTRTNRRFSKTRLDARTKAKKRTCPGKPGRMVTLYAYSDFGFPGFMSAYAMRDFCNDRCPSVRLSVPSAVGRHLPLSAAWARAADIVRLLPAPRTGCRSISAGARAAAAGSVMLRAEVRRLNTDLLSVRSAGQKPNSCFIVYYCLTIVLDFTGI